MASLSLYSYGSIVSFLVLSSVGLGLTISSFYGIKFDGDTSNNFIDNDQTMIAGLVIAGLALFMSTVIPYNQTAKFLVIAMTTISVAILGMMYFGQTSANRELWNTHLSENLKISWLQSIVAITVIGFMLILFQMIYPLRIAKMLSGTLMLALVVVTSIFAAGLENCYDALKPGAILGTSMDRSKLDTTRNLSWAVIALSYTVFLHGLTLFR